MEREKQMKKLTSLSLCSIALIALSGCAFNAKDEVPGVQWKSAVVSVNTNGTASLAIVGYNSKKDISFQFNPETKLFTLGAVMNPANTQASGVASQLQITAQGDAVNKVMQSIGSTVGTVAGTAAGAALIGK